MKKILLLVALLLIPRLVCSALPITFTNGTVADATEVNQNLVFLDNKFSTTSGHDHDGSDSKIVTDLTGSSELGTITTGVWQGTIVDTTYGGTGQSTYASGDMVFASSDNTFVKRALGSLGSIMIVNSDKSEPDWHASGAAGRTLKSAGTTTNPIWIGSVVGTFIRTIAEGDGNQVITGLGFTPKAVFFVALDPGTKEASWGFDSVAIGSPTGVGIFFDPNTSFYETSGSKSIHVAESGSTYIEGSIVSTEVDGFTFSWGVVGSPTGTIEVFYSAI